MAMHSWISIALWTGCTSDPVAQQSSPTEKLVTASEKVIFASVEKLGAHRSISTFDRTEYLDGNVRSEHQEILEISWRDWDNFQYARRVDDEVAAEVVIADFETWAYSSAGWKRQPDGELYRVQLRSTWNQWDNMMHSFVEHVEWEAVGQEIIEGRKTQKYVANFIPPQQARAGVRPISFDGAVWVDEQTAVRLLGTITGEMGQEPHRTKLKLQIQRVDINADFKIVPPAERTD